MEDPSFIVSATLLVQLLAFGGACHVAVVSRKRGWWLLAAGVSVTMLRRGIAIAPEQMAYFSAVHAALMLAGITLIFRSYQQTVDDLVELADHVPNMVAITDAKGEATYLNRRWKTYAGVRVVDFRHRGWERLIHPDDLMAVVGRWDSSLLTTNPFEMELRIRSETGAYRWFLCRAVPIRNATGKVARWFASCTDVHECKEGTLWLTRKALEVEQGRKGETA